MVNRETDKEWEKFGKEDPYFGVLTHEKFLTINLTEETLEEFFKSGFDYIDNLFGTIQQPIDQDFTVKKALDFGCGVGRLVIPLAKVALEVTGIDVSDSMLKEAKKNCESRSINNVVLVKSDDNLSALNGKYAFIHSFIVFQHIPVTRGEQIFENLIEHLESGGICVAHFTYAYNSRRKRFYNNLIRFIKRDIPLSNNIISLIKKIKAPGPHMQMNSYDLNHLFLMIQRANIVDFYTEFTNHGGMLGVVVYFKRP